MTNALLKVFPIILLVAVVASLPKVTCLRLQVDPQKYVGDGLHPSAFKREDEQQDRLFLTTRYGKRDRSYPDGNRLNNKRLTRFINTVEGNQIDGRNHFIEVAKAILEMKSDLRIVMSYLHELLEAPQKQCDSYTTDLKNLEEPSGRKQ